MGPRQYNAPFFLPSNGPLSDSTTLKRNRSNLADEEASGPPVLPPLPNIKGELILELFTHKSLRRIYLTPSGSDSSEFGGDNERLSELGVNVLSAVVTHHLFAQKLLMNANEIAMYREAILLGGNIKEWVDFYQLRERLRCHPDALGSLMTTEESRLLFHSYVGAILVDSGYDVVHQWLISLLEVSVRLNFTRNNPIKTPAEGTKRIKIEPEIEGTSRITMDSAPATAAPPPPPQVKPKQRAMSSRSSDSPLPSGSSTKASNPLAPARPHLPFLPLFNQAAHQRGVSVAYPTAASGPPHACQWIAECVVNGIVKGRGISTSKQIAKEDSARQAYAAMGWAPYG